MRGVEIAPRRRGTPAAPPSSARPDARILVTCSASAKPASGLPVIWTKSAATLPGCVVVDERRAVRDRPLEIELDAAAARSRPRPAPRRPRRRSGRRRRPSPPSGRHSRRRRSPAAAACAASGHRGMRDEQRHLAVEARRCRRRCRPRRRRDGRAPRRRRCRRSARARRGCAQKATCSALGERGCRRGRRPRRAAAAGRSLRLIRAPKVRVDIVSPRSPAARPPGAPPRRCSGSPCSGRDCRDSASRMPSSVRSVRPGYSNCEECS